MCAGCRNFRKNWQVGEIITHLFYKIYLDVSRLNKTKIDIDFLELIVYNTGTRSVESDGRGHGNSPLAAVGDREAVGSRHSAQTSRRLPP